MEIKRNLARPSGRCFLGIAKETASSRMVEAGKKEEERHGGRGGQPRSIDSSKAERGRHGTHRRRVRVEGKCSGHVTAPRTRVYA